MRRQHAVRSSLLAGALLALTAPLTLLPRESAQAVVQPVAENNLVTNASFETLPGSEWKKQSSTLTQVEDATSPDPTDSAARTVARIEPAGTPSAYGIYTGSASQPLSKTGHTYFGSVWVKGTAASAGQQIEVALIAQESGTWADLYSSRNRVLLSTSWTRVQVALTVPASSLTVRLSINRPISQHPWSSPDAFFVDGVSVTDNVDPSTLVANGSFEANTTGWTCSRGTLTTISDTTAPAGAGVMRIAHSGCGALTTTEDYLAFQNVGAFPRGTTATGKVWVRAEGSGMTGRPATLRLREYDGTTLVATKSQPITLSTAWQPVTTSLTSTGGSAGNSTLRVEIAGNGPANATFLVDGFQVTSTPAAALPAPNLVPNPTFEANTASWSCLGSTLTSLAAVTTAPHGLRVAKVAQSSSCATGTGGGPGATVAVPTRKGLSYVTKFWAKGATGTTGDVLTATVKSASGTTLASKTATLTSAYQQITLPTFVPTTDGDVTLQVKTPNGVVGDYFLVDGFSATGQWISDFTGAAGAAPDPAVWTVQDLAHIRDACFEPSQAKLDGAGAVRLRVEPGTCPGWAWDPDQSEEPASQLVGANMFTEGHIDFLRYGRFEARIRSHSTDSGWPAFWLRRTEQDETWPTSGEIDVTDGLDFWGVIGAGDPTVCVPDDDTTPESEGTGIDYNGTYGCNYSDKLRDERGNNVTFQGDGAWHVYRMDWTSGSFRFFVDDRLYGVVRAADYQAWAGKPWPFDDPAARWYPILTMNSSSPDPTTLPNGDEILVDWVKVTQLP